MVHEEEIGRLERLVEKLLGGYNSLKVELDNLQEELRQKEEQNRDLQASVDRFQLEKETVYGRVTSLVDKIDTWEKENEMGKDVIQPTENVQADSPVDNESSLFTMGEERNPGGAMS